MELFLHQQFDALLRAATASFAERCAYRAGGPDAAVALLHSDPGCQALGRSEFISAFLAENLLDNLGGYCFILQALERRMLPADQGGPVAEVLGRMARAAFAEVLTGMTAQVLQLEQIHS